MMVCRNTVPRMSRRARGAVLAMVVSACAGGTDKADTAAATPSSRFEAGAVTAALAELRLPAATAGEMARDSAWRVFIDTTDTPRVVLVHKVAALVLPDGPFELLAPLTYFQYSGDRWQQATQDKGGVSLTPMAQAALASEFDDRERIYFFRVRTVVLSSRVEHPELVAQLRAVADEMRREVDQWLKDGFIGADAEP